MPWNETAETVRQLFKAALGLLLELIGLVLFVLRKSNNCFSFLSVWKRNVLCSFSVGADLLTGRAKVLRLVFSVILGGRYCDRVSETSDVGF